MDWHRSTVTLFALLLAVVSCLSVGAGELRVCVSTSALFFSITDGKPSGIEYEILKGFAERRGLGLDLVKVTFSELIPKLEKHECEVGAGQMTRTLDRERFVDFSASYFPVRIALLQLRGQAPLDVGNLKGTRVLVSKGTAWESAVKGVPGLIAVEDLDGRPSIEQIRAGLADAVATDSTMVQASLTRNPDLQLACFLPGREEYGFPMPEGSSLKAAIDEYLAVIKADGTFKAILNRYLDSETGGLIVELLHAPK